SPAAPPPSVAEQPTADEHGRETPLDPWRIAPTLIAAAISAVYLLTEPRSPDLAAHIFRSELFGREGFTIWNGQWYGGHHTPAYSILSPPLSWLLGPQLMGALSAVAATACFTELMRRTYGSTAARLGTAWFGIGFGMWLFTNRLPFLLGAAFAIAAVLALQRDRRALAAVLAVLSAISSPVAGLFLAMGGVAHALAHWRRARTNGGRSARVDGIALAAAAFIPPVLLTIAFPEGGYAPFPLSAYLPIPLFAVGCVLVIPRDQPTLRWAAALYGLGATLALVIDTAMGGNAVRLGALLGGPVMACVLWPRLRSRPVMPWLLALGALAVWQMSPAVRDIYKAIDDPVAKASYFDPLREWLRLQPDQRRIEIPFTFGHWEGAEVASEAPLARGWLRQLDTGRHPIFYGNGLNAVTYADWLTRNGVRYVALPDAKPDSSSYRERALIESGLDYLRLRKRFEHWRIYEVTLPTPLVLPDGRADIRLEQLGSDRVLLRVMRPGEALVRVRWTPYWLAKGGCVERDGEWTRVIAEKQGFLELVTRFGPERIVEHGRRCNDG
ncbi:MAG TPA: hypothetical protein VHF90_01965, partial [Thermoleophilaceae bacterium]|nr:hypothetical protein [Thermoleophilaceae bacterium]